VERPGQAKKNWKVKIARKKERFDQLSDKGLGRRNERPYKTSHGHRPWVDVSINVMSTGQKTRVSRTGPAGRPQDSDRRRKKSEGKHKRAGDRHSGKARFSHGRRGMVDCRAALRRQKDSAKEEGNECWEKTPGSGFLQTVGGQPAWCRIGEWGFRRETCGGKCPVHTAEKEGTGWVHAEQT